MGELKRTRFMKSILRIFLVCVIAVLTGCKGSAVALPAEKGEPGFNKDPRVDALWNDVNASDDGFDTTGYFDFILEACHLGMDVKYVKAALQRFCACQAQELPDLGKVPRTIGGDMSDENNIEFALELAGPALIEYYPGWPEDVKALFDDFVDKALYASWNHDNVAVSYSNIYIMRAWNMVALGENLSGNRTWGCGHNLTPAEIAAKGYSMLGEFYGFLCDWGIHEHNSPTYTGVQAECIGYLAKYTKNEEARAMALKCRDYLSACIFANYFTPGKVSSGPMSRCYYRGSSGGKIDQLAGGLIYGYGMYWYNVLASWEPSAQDRRINDTYPRTVAWTFGPEKGTDASGKEYYAMNAMNYIDRKFSISSAGHHYTGNGTEKSLSVVVAGNSHRDIINFAHYMEGRNDPFGRIPYGSHVWTCFRDAWARSQNANEVVVLQAGNGRDNPPAASNLCSHIIVPGTYVDEMWVGNERVSDWFAMSGNAKALNQAGGMTYFSRIEDIVVSIRYLFTFGTDGRMKTPVLTYDSNNSSYVYGTALRITTELKGTAPSPDELGGVIMWWRVDKDIDTDEKFEALRNSIINSPVSVPEQKAYTEDDGIECFVTTPEGLKLGIKGNFVKKKYYNRWIYSDTVPEYMNESYWYFDQKEAYGSGIDFSDRSQAFLSVNGEDVGLAITGQN